MEAGQGHTLEAALPEGCADAALRPADILLKTWSKGMDTAVDITIAHGWQQAEQTVTREKWRTFLTRNEEAKKAKYVTPCKKADWEFIPMAFGTWGGQVPGGAKLLARILKRAAGWQEGDLRASLQEQFRLSVGLALSRGVWAQLDTRNFC